MVFYSSVPIVVSPTHFIRSPDRRKGFQHKDELQRTCFIYAHHGDNRIRSLWLENRNSTNWISSLIPQQGNELLLVFCSRNSKTRQSENGAW